jgi:methionyl-tRNA formyltransferase
MRDVLLIGMGITASAALQSLTTSNRVVGLVRNGEATGPLADETMRLAQSLKIPIFTDTSIRGVRAVVERLRPACVVISSHDRVLPADLLALCPFVNVHYAPLPRFRGRANVNWAIINQESVTAITIHKVEPGLDAGAILFQRIIPIGRNDTVADLYERLNALQLQHLGDTVARHLEGREPGEPQVEDSATYGCTRLPADGEIDWSADTASIEALIRGLAKPFPGAFTYVDGRRVVIWRARAVEHPPVYEGRVPGRVIRVAVADGDVDVLTGDGVLRLIEIQTEDGPAVPAASLVRSVRATFGLKTIDLLSRIEALEREIAALRERIPATGEKNVLV